MFGAVLVVSIEALVLIAIWRWDDQVRSADMRQRRQRFLAMRGHHTDGSHPAPPSSVVNPAR